MPVRHTYFNASDNHPQFAADHCQRQAVTVSEVCADDRFCDLPMYRFDKEADDMGMDPWRMVSVYANSDPKADHPFMIENHAGTRHVGVGPDAVVFAQKRDLKRLGIEIPVSVMDQFHLDRIKPGLDPLVAHRQALHKAMEDRVVVEKEQS